MSHDIPDRNIKSQEKPKPESQGVELSPEIVEKIMEKVRDLNLADTAVTALNTNLDDEESRRTLMIQLQKGLLGKSQAASMPSDYNMDVWYKQARIEKKATLWCNIVGRSAKEASKTYYLDEISICFSLKGFREEFPMRDVMARKVNTPAAGSEILSALGLGRDLDISLSDLIIKIEEYIKVNGPRLNAGCETTEKDGVLTWTPGINLLNVLKKINEKKNFDPLFAYIDSEWGYAIKHRVPPRNFYGIILRPREPNGEYITYNTSQTESVREFSNDPEAMKKKVAILARLMVVAYKGREGLIMPIYDKDCNLLWPKQMSYEEVKRFVAERDGREKESVDGEVKPELTGDSKWDNISE
ncbi:MAG: hypothetical protein UV97_C0018G0005 [Candidatus Yanofskybacteria bacterium GW2011_GWF2_43_596]|nr:MAG: hypothetical protein UV97_C0018G0005 [Candidatus Yanofskybacteria bacterium GW2011_GWF2_43_596]